jgi:hypothetical protein
MSSSILIVIRDLPFGEGATAPRRPFEKSSSFVIVFSSRK